jgi:uncharacterized protein DUF4432
MPRCAAEAVQWKNRGAYRLSNGVVELTVLPGGGHIADFRLCDSPINALWEAPWQTIEPQTFSSHEHAALYGDGPVGKLLCGYTGHALVLGYFGMPSAVEAAQGLALHGEATSSEWKIVSAAGNDHSASLVLEVALPVYQLHFQRRISLPVEAFTACITEVVTNRSDNEVEFQWMEHAAFGEPLFRNGEASLFISGTLGLTWPLGYEGHELLSNNTEYRWPHAPSTGGGQIDLSQAFVRDGTGFVAALLTDPDREKAFAAVHNRRHALVAGYSFDRARFPWIALWEENRARGYAPWNGITRARGVEFGTSPMPLGLDQAREIRTLFDTSVLANIPGNSSIETQYQLFLSPVPPEWTEIKDVRQSDNTLVVRGDGNEEIKLDCGRPARLA